MKTSSLMPLALGLIIFSFIVTSLLVIPFINLLYKMRLIRKKQAPKNGKVPLFDKLYDAKAGTPEGAGALIIVIVTILFSAILPLVSYLGVYINSAHNLRWELIIIFFTFISFGLLGLLDDVIKIFGKPQKGTLGFAFGLSRKQKFLLQWILAFIISWMIYNCLGVQIIHIPIWSVTLDLRIFYIPLSALVIATFANAFNITDGLDGLSCGLLMIFLIAFSVIAVAIVDTPLWIFMGLWLGAILAFLYFNVWPARVILGDAGALSFGATIAVIGLLTGKVFALFVIGGLFLVEVASSALQIAGWKLFKRALLPLAPLHHAFRAIGWEEPKIVMRAWLAGIVLAIFGLWLASI